MYAVAGGAGGGSCRGAKHWVQAPHPFHIHNWFHGWLLRVQNGWHRAGGGAGGEGGTGSGRGGGVRQSVQPPQPDQRHLALHVCVLRGQKALHICVDGHWVQAPQPVHAHRASHGCVLYSQWPRQPGGGGAGGGEGASAVTACMIANTGMPGSCGTLELVGPSLARQAVQVILICNLELSCLNSNL